MGSFPFANAVWQKQVTRHSDRCLLEEKQRLSADMGRRDTCMEDPSQVENELLNQVRRLAVSGSGVTSPGYLEET